MHPLNRLLAKAGFQVRRLPHDIGAKPDYIHMLEHFGIDHVLDVGAFKGFSALGLFNSGFTGSIVSFEPVIAHFEALQSAIQASAPHLWKWRALHMALGSESCLDSIHVSGNGESSSLAPMMPEHWALNPDSKYVATETVTVQTLDNIYAEVVPDGRKTLLQLDVQGFEKQALAGAAQSLHKLAAVQLEVSLRPVYEGGLGIVEAFQKMEAIDYIPVYVQPAWKDVESRIFYQLDVLWLRREIAESR